eukprot:CCRYP_000933-RA/>CCRYP_000933-RA protein AED:0.36 eAED:0.36 QI:0/-1/0/1/-1/1/1/0/286
MDEVEPSTLITVARSHLECVQKILKQVNEGSMTSDARHRSRKGSSNGYRSLREFPSTGVPNLELRPQKASVTPLDNSNTRSLDLKSELEIYGSKHRQHESSATEWERTTLFHQSGLSRSDLDFSLTPIVTRVGKTGTSFHLSSPRKKTRNHPVSRTENRKRFNRLAPQSSDSNRSPRKDVEFSQSDSNIMRECLNYPCHRDRSELVQFRVRRLPSRSEESSSSDVTNKFSKEDVSVPSILRRTKSVSHNIRLGKRVSFIDDLSRSCHDNNYLKADAPGHVLKGPNQ